ACPGVHPETDAARRVAPEAFAVTARSAAAAMLLTAREFVESIRDAGDGGSPRGGPASRLRAGAFPRPSRSGRCVRPRTGLGRAAGGPAGVARRARSNPAAVYELRITLADIKPPV